MAELWQDLWRNIFGLPIHYWHTPADHHRREPRMSPISEYLTETDGRWVARIVYVEGGQRRERKRVLGPVPPGRGRPKAGAIPRAEALERLADVRAELEQELARSPEQRDRREHATLLTLALAWLHDAGRSAGRPWKPSTRSSVPLDTCVRIPGISVIVGMPFSRASSAACDPCPSDSTTMAITWDFGRRTTSDGSNRSTTSTLFSGMD